MSKIARKGPPKWAGCRYIIDQEVTPVAQKFGIPITSRKRGTILNGNVGSDHNLFNLTADAVDLGTFSGANLAHAIAKELGINNYSTGNFNGYNITRNGATFRVQILWAVVNHFNHVHVGVKLVAGQYTVKDPKVKTGDTIRYGDKGPGVLVLQKQLRQHGFFKKEWGFGKRYGVKTRRAVKRFQKAKFGAKGVDGVVGPFTWAELKKQPIKPENPQPKPNPPKPPKPPDKPQNTKPQRMSRKGLEMLAGFEGFRPKPYKVHSGEQFWTIGFGHYGPDVKAGMNITREEGLALLKKDVASREKIVRDLVKVKLTQNQFDSLTSLVFNIGVGNVSSSTLLKLLNQGKYRQAARQFIYKGTDGKWHGWIYSGGRIFEGLIKRRQVEQKLFKEVK